MTKAAVESSDAAGVGSEARRGTADAPETTLQLSVIVPVTERPEPLDDLFREFAAPLEEAGYDFEFVFVVEPWRRQLVEPLRQLSDDGEPVRVLTVGQGMDESSLLKAALTRARGELVLTLPAYRRVVPESLPRLVRRVEEGADLASAARRPRRDAWINRLQSRVFQMMVDAAAPAHMEDVACGVRAMRRQVLEETPLYGDFYRFLPLLADREGFRVDVVPCPQHPADTEARVYAPGVYLRRLIDLVGVFFLLRFTYKPLRFFGLVGSATALLGFAVLAVITVQRFAGQGIADRPLLLLGVLLITLGMQSVALGLVGEIIVHFNASGRRTYRLARDEDEDRS